MLKTNSTFVIDFVSQKKWTGVHFFYEMLKWHIWVLPILRLELLYYFYLFFRLVTDKPSTLRIETPINPRTLDFSPVFGNDLSCFLFNVPL